MTLGRRIKRARERLKPPLTQKAVADLFEISPQAVSGWERDDSIPEHEKLPILARALKVPVIWLLDGKGTPPDPDSIAVVIEDLSDEEMLTVMAVIESFRKRRGHVA